ncbi:pentapeptide repeat-containing protein [Pseudodonghicola flavimaris]|uniref:Pentapeptide repeat-containing protein n=1 Tax=Pseudodonghicola flavimaris TaxID=3050036 RepID=A0ABT7F7C5_9RHOB|nr:pentapeptide repeat-containing protein [Pseudodonghicola flavimaris]MDK3020506.1 pentapeptide repeat-containing protein [Pseudodonghicola flavimaris]
MSDQPTTTLPIPPDVFWAITGIGGMALLTLVIFGAMIPAGSSHVAPLERLKDRLGLTSLNSGLFLIALGFWGALFLTLTVGLIWLIWDLIWMGIPGDTAKVWGFSIARIAGLTATLGAVVALPFTLIKVRMTARQTDTAAESLFNDKINTASDDLHAMRQRWDETEKQNIWEPDIVRRNAAIDRLEGLAKEQPSEVPRIVRMLSVYVRELSKEVPPEPAPPDARPDQLKDWARQLTVKRSDMQTAVQALGRLRKSFDGAFDPKTIDLTGANLQGMLLSHDGFNFGGILLAEASMQGADLWGAKLQGADLGRAELQGADLWGAKLQGADLWGAKLQGAGLWSAELQGVYLERAELQGVYLERAKLQGANLERAELQGANLERAKLQGADLWSAELQGVYLERAEFDTSTSLTAATLRGAAVSEVDFTNIPEITPHIDQVFGDATVTLPGGVTRDHPDWPPHFSREKLIGDDFETAWRAFQKSIGFDPDDPSTWDDPQDTPP